MIFVYSRIDISSDETNVNLITIFLLLLYIIDIYSEILMILKSKIMHHLFLLISTIPIVESNAEKIGAGVILNRLFNESYDVRVPPPSANGGEGPVDIGVSLLVRSISNVDVVAKTYDLEITFREHWKDARLAYDHIQGQLPKHIVIHDKDTVWRPDTYFQNEKRAHHHELDKPNVFIKMMPDGSVFFSERLTLTLSCPMLLDMFPFDEHRCNLDIASYAYSADDIVYKWAKNSPVQLKLNYYYSLSSFFLDGGPNHTICSSRTNTGDYPCLQANFWLARVSRYYYNHVYIPSILLVSISWGSFWLDQSAASARLALGIIPLFMMSNQAADINNKLPPVHYIKAIDVWFGGCFIFIFGAILEYVWVTYMANLNEQREKTQRCCSSNGKSTTISPMDDSNPTREDASLLSSSLSNSNCWLEAKRIDITCRIVFPIAFFIFIAVYWANYVLLASKKN
ncbi:hypothetical protein PFISCL1PPCAC_17539 [Pristionchus fissidentatus]|uniref:Ig-like domain-containing protein n=1 Tax=Pristionchus fissidentatus TaxID=1538716 RepID=A0AAV5W334_9BILA|nr:hypothetical protein PFISCL1PPCAC_17539 [Pristionchus fissidentatus]